MKQVLIRSGQPVVEEVPAPRLERGCVLVSAAFSCVSPGTEMASLRATARPLWKRALREPANVVKVLNHLRERGLAATSGLVRAQVDRAFTTGYSMAGTVVAVGDGVADLRVGDRVACGGSQYAHHAQMVRVPRNLVAPIPDGLDLEAASTVTLGAIALQGVRRFQPTLGETCIVIGLGLIGQLTVQLAKAAGCRVVALDLDADRTATALALGADAGFAPEGGGELERIMRITDGHGADGVIITAASQSDALIASAFQMCRRKGRVVLVGDVGLNIRRADIYEKELDFLVSTSYGPGRYDHAYEEDGLDYPIGYVRWTENRNMAAYLDMLAARRVRADFVTRHVFDLEAAPQAYRALEAKQALGTLLRYPLQDGAAATRVVLTAGARRAEGVLRLGIVGAGAFARAAHLPALQALGNRYSIAAVACRSGPNAQDVARRVGARFATTDAEEIFADAEIDAVLIATRHDLHTPLALQALAAGKHVLVEKPLALTRAELDAVQSFFAGREQAPVLLTGYNRRFSPAIEFMRARTAARDNPMMITYRMNAGRLPDDHWTFGPQGGGRNLGEACHIYDLFTCLTQSELASVAVTALRPSTRYYRSDDNFVATLAFRDGSVATLTYTALGTSRLAKESMELFCDGRVFTLDDYRSWSEHADPEPRTHRVRTQEKGLVEELKAFHAAATGGGDWPIPLWQQIQAARIAFDVDDGLRAQGQPTGSSGLSQEQP